MAHKGHPVCEHSSKAACDKARKIAIGQCSAMLDELRQCPHWGIDRVDDRAYCGQHIGSVYRAADEARRMLARRRQLNDLIDGYLARHGLTAHACGDHCEYSSIVLF